MNLKISDNSFRFRITPQDLDQLLQGRDVEQRVSLGHHCFAYRITPTREAQQGLNLEMAVGGFCLSVSPDMLKNLGGMGRSKEGISTRQNGVEIALQVDIRAQMKKAA